MKPAPWLQPDPQSPEPEKSGIDWRAVGIVIALILTAGFVVFMLAGCARESPETQAAHARVGEAIGEYHATGLRSAPDMALDIAALRQIDVALSTSAAQQALYEAWQVLRGLVPQLASQALVGWLAAGTTPTQDAPEGLP